MTAPATTVTPEDSPEAKRYGAIRRRLALADAILGLAFLVVLLASGWTRHLRDISVRWGRDHYALGLFLYIFLLLLIAKVLTLGLDLYGFRLEHRFHLSNQKLSSWVVDEVKGWLVGLVLGSLVAEIVYGIIRRSPSQWWLISWGAFMLLLLFFAQIAPVVLLPIFFKFKPLQNEGLKQRLVRLSERSGTRVRGIYEWQLSEKSRKANAALTGLGKTRRIILADTLLQNYSDDEIEAILAHELGHHVRNHILKSIGVQAGITFLGFWLAGQVLHYVVDQRHMFEGPYDFAGIPLLVLTFSVLSLLLMPALNAWSRHNEREADLYCWQSVPDVGPFVSSMNKLNQQNLSEANPSRWIEVLFHSHPAVSKRIAAAQQFAEEHSQSGAPR